MNPGGSFGRSPRPSAGSQSGHGISRRSAFAGARRSECVPRQVGVSLTHEERVVAAFALGWHANLQRCGSLLSRASVRALRSHARLARLRKLTESIFVTVSRATWQPTGTVM